MSQMKSSYFAIATWVLGLAASGVAVNAVEETEEVGIFSYGSADISAGDQVGYEVDSLYNNYLLTFDNLNLGGAEAVAPLILRYKDQIGKVQINLRNSTNRFDIDLYLGNSKIIPSNDQAKDFIVSIDESAPVAWRGNIKNLGKSRLAFIPRARAYNKVQFTWEISEDEYTATSDYSFLNWTPSGTRNIFEANLHKTDGVFAISQNAVLAINNGVVLRFFGNSNLIFNQNTEDDKAGTLSHYLSSPTRYGKLIMDSDQDRLILQRLELNINDYFYTFFGTRFQNPITLIEVTEASDTKICFAADLERCTNSEEELRYLAFNDEHKPHLEVTISAARDRLMLRKLSGQPPAILTSGDTTAIRVVDPATGYFNVEQYQPDDEDTLKFKGKNKYYITANNFTAAQDFEIHYHNTPQMVRFVLGGTTSNNPITASFKLYHNNRLLSRSYDALKRFAFYIGRRATGAVTWQGDIINRGMSFLHFVPQRPAFGSGNATVTNFVWDLSSKPYGSSDYYSSTYLYQFENPYEPVKFNVQINIPEQGFPIRSGGVLSIAQGVTLTFTSTEPGRGLFFQVASGYQDMSKMGTLSFSLSSKSTAGKLIVDTGQTLLALKKVQLRILASSDGFYSEEWADDEFLTLVEIAQNRNTQLCFTSDLESCISSNAPLRYLVANEEGKPDWEMVISAERNRLMLKKLSEPAPDELIHGRDVKIISIVNYLDKNFSVSYADTLEQRRLANTARSRQVTLAARFKQNLLISGLFESLPESFFKNSTTTRRASNNSPTEEIADTPDNQLGNRTFLKIASNVKFGWAKDRANNNGRTQNFNLQIGGSTYKQLSGNLVAFYTHSTNGNVIDNLMIGGITQLTYHIADTGITTSIYFGGGFSSMPNMRWQHRALLSGLIFGYRYSYTETVGITLIPEVRVDLIALSTNTGTVPSLSPFVRNQASLNLELNTGNSLGNYQLQLSVPLRLGVITTTRLVRTDTKPYEFYGHTGLQARLALQKNMFAQIGYGFRYGEFYLKHSLSLRFQLQM